MFFLCFQEEEQTYLQKAERLNNLMNAVTDKVKGGRGLGCAASNFSFLAGGLSQF